MKRILVLILASLMLMAVGCSCGGDESSTEDFLRTAAPDDAYLKPEGMPSDGNGEIPDDAFNMSEAVPNFQVAAFTKMNVKANSEDIRVVFSNPEVNACYMTFVLEILTLDANGNIASILELYRTPDGEFVAPGETVSSIKINEALKAGEYDARLITTFYNLDTKAPYANKSSMQFTLVAKG